MAVGAAVAWWRANADLMLREMFKDNFDLDVEINLPDARKDNSRSALKSMEKVMLPFLLNGAGGHRGLFVLDGPLIDALIELQMLDKVLPTPRLDRPITTIDAGLSESFVHLCLKSMGDAPGLMSDFSVVRAEQDRAALRLALKDSQFDILPVQIDMGPGIKTGLFEIWIPDFKLPEAPPAEPNPQMAKLLAECEAEFEARVIGCQVSAADLVALAPGAVLRLPGNIISDVTLSDCDDRRVATGRLGQLNGRRAVMITEMVGDATKSRVEPVASEPLAGPLPALPGADLGQPDIDLPQPDMGLAEPLADLPDLPMANIDLPELDEENGPIDFDPTAASAV